ncbi:EAL domain-containing protein [Cohnella fermenti]|uniref:EAL domain-containing protein n=1 Tax=Cohnella fermenti TaxID=2565925 RepID=A0A4S4C3Q5_9BACL|nr:EAL domain-containing protein [Cohnella fermenti]THF81730.1 EAL domain-containing protein [Cohnella fermenti]
MTEQASARTVPLSPPEEQIAAYYQPILALDTRRIVGYEVLGRQVDENGGVKSLGPFFTDSRVDVSEQIRIDRLLREKAIAKAGTFPEPPSIFLNLKPSWIYRHYKLTGELHTLQLLDRYGIDPSRVCIEITEEEFRGSFLELGEIIDIYRKQGCRIAIDDVGSDFSSYDRIAQLRPHLLKVDIHLMKRSASHDGYLGVLRSFSTLAEQIGASLLVEGVETRQDLRRAIQIGARYVQGYLFSPAEPDFRKGDEFARLIEEELEEHRQLLHRTEHYWVRRAAELFRSMHSNAVHQELEAEEHRFQAEEEGTAASDEADCILQRWVPYLDSFCLRVYLCLDNGTQISSNHVRNPDGSWHIESEYRGSDWSWRPYFIPHLSQIEGRTDSKLSPQYADLNTRRWIRTLSIPVGRRLVLFLDIVEPVL